VDVGTDAEQRHETEQDDDAEYPELVADAFEVALKALAQLAPLDGRGVTLTLQQVKQHLLGRFGHRVVLLLGR